MYISEQDYLIHYGVKGMKWGVRKDRYDTPRVRRARDVYKKMLYDPRHGENYKRAVKKEYDDAKAEARIQVKKIKLSDKEKNLMKEYMSKYNMTKEEARIEAYKTERMKKVALAVGGMTLAAAAAYVGRKAFVKNVDTFIKAGTRLQNLNNHNPQQMVQAFYAVLNKSDKLLYKATYATNLAAKGDVWNTTIKTTKGIKVASERTGRKTLENLIKTDRDFAQDFGKSLLDRVQSPFTSPARKKLYEQAIQDLNKGKVTSKVYDARNVFLVQRTGETATQNAKFYKVLKDKGYGAIRDRNDMKYSGFKAKAPTIFFDTAKTTVEKSAKLTVDEIRAAMDTRAKQQYIKAFVTSYGRDLGVPIGVGSAIGGVANAVKTKTDREYVRQYREEHPNSELSYNDIVRRMRKT